MLDAVQGYVTPIFGGWTNFTQGAGGAILGVVGAYMVAAATARREIARDRRRAREEAARAAAGDLIRALLDLARHVKQIKRLGWTSGSGVGTHQLTAWEARREDFTGEVSAHGGLLPDALEGKATAIINQLDSVMMVDFDETDFPILIEPGNEADLDAIVAATDDLVVDLQKFRRDPDKADEQRRWILRGRSARTRGPRLEKPQGQHHTEGEHQNRAAGPADAEEA